MRRLLVLLALCLWLVASACGTAQETPEPTSGAPSSPGRNNDLDPGKDSKAPAPKNPAPDFEVTTFSGDTFALGEQRGTPVVLNFWESW